MGWGPATPINSCPVSACCSQAFVSARNHWRRGAVCGGRPSPGGDQATNHHWHHAHTRTTIHANVCACFCPPAQAFVCAVIGGGALFGASFPWGRRARDMGKRKYQRVVLFCNGPVLRPVAVCPHLGAAVLVPMCASARACTLAHTLSHTHTHAITMSHTCHHTHTHTPSAWPPSCSYHASLL